MLVKFSVKNYRNFKEKTTIDFEEKHDYKFNKECIKDNLVTKSIIFGKNGCGKSNFGLALFDIVATLTENHVNSKLINTNNFANADNQSQIVEFFYEFKFKGKKVEYNYKKLAVNVMAYEELIIDGEKIFYFDFLEKKGEFKNLNIISAETLKIDIDKIKFSIVRLIANNTIQEEGSIIKELINFVSNMLWFRSLKQNAFIGMTTENVVISDWVIKNNLTNELKEFIKELAGLKLDFETIKIGDENILLEKHKYNPLKFEEVASSGTEALFLLFYWSKYFSKASIIFIDEFDAFYHFELSRNVVEMLKKLENTQVILTSHNTFLASNELLRPDCYFTLENGKLTTFADGTNRELREGHNLEKMLRKGEFNEE